MMSIKVTRARGLANGKTAIPACGLGGNEANAAESVSSTARLLAPERVRDCWFTGTR